MTRRQLPPEEWDKLKGTTLEGYAPHMDPRRTRVVVVEDEGQIVACVALMFVLNAHGLWGKTGAMSKEAWMLLFDGFNEAATSAGVDAVMAGADTPMMARLLAKHDGAPLEMQPYVLMIPFGPFGIEGEPCRS